MLQNPAYQPLRAEKKEIRALHLNEFVPGSPHGYNEQCISGRLAHISLEEHPSYYALSYVWGDPSPVSAIIVDGGAAIPIGHNLFNALQHLRRNDFLPAGVPIWIDAACINQSDNVEKSAQVALMTSIYSMAEKTIIFLGKSSEGSDQVMRLLDAIGGRICEYNGRHYSDLHWKMLLLVTSASKYRRIPRKLGLRRILWSIWGMRRRHWAHYLIREFSCAALKEDQPVTNAHITTFSNLPWWTRVWVLQELLLSPSPWFVYGNQIVAAERVTAAFTFLDNLEWYLYGLRDSGLKLPKVAGILRNMFTEDRFIRSPRLISLYVEREALDWSLGFILTKIRERETIPQASNPRDQIYGLLGLITSWPSHQSRIQPDYSLTPGEAFAKATVVVLQTTKPGSNSIFRTSTYPKSVPDLPSWVPDWASKWEDENLFVQSMWFNSGATTYQATLDGKQLLTICGHAYGSIKIFDTPKDTFNQLGSSHSYGSWLASIATRLGLLHDQACPGANMNDIFPSHIQAASLAIALSLSPRLLKTIYMGVLTGDNNTRQINRQRLIIQLAEEFSKEITQLLQAWMNKQQQEPSQRFLDRIALSESNPSLEETVIRTADDYFGVAQSTVQEGDLIVQFDIDPHMYFVVRPVEDGLYQLMSMAYMPRLAKERKVVQDRRMEFTLC